MVLASKLGAVGVSYTFFFEITGKMIQLTNALGDQPPVFPQQRVLWIWMDLVLGDPSLAESYLGKDRGILSNPIHASGCT